MNQNQLLREALQRIQYKATSLADAQVIALEALALPTEPADGGEVVETVPREWHSIGGQEVEYVRADIATPKPQPMTDEQLVEVLTTAYGSPEWTMDDVRAARAIEAHHHITSKEGVEG